MKIKITFTKTFMLKSNSNTVNLKTDTTDINEIYNNLINRAKINTFEKITDHVIKITTNTDILLSDFSSKSLVI